MECAVYSGKKGGQLVVQWVKHCKDNSIDVIQEFCRENNDGVRKKLIVYDNVILYTYIRTYINVDQKVVSLCGKYLFTSNQ